MTTTHTAPTSSHVGTGPSAIAGRDAGRRAATRTTVFACLAMAVAYLPFSAVNGALGIIGSETGAGTTDLQWLTDAFALALAATVLTAGALADVRGRRTIVLAGLGLTSFGAALAMAAASAGAATIPLLWVAQAAAGLGGAAVMSASLGLVSAVAANPAARRRGVAAWAASITVGLGGGPFLTAAMTAWADWRWLFAPILVLAVATAAFGFRHAVETRAHSARSPEPSGPVLSAAGVVALVVAVVRGGTAGWTDPVTLVTVVLAVGCAAGFVRRQRRAAAPLLRPELFTSRRFTAAGLAAASMLFSVVGTVFVLSLLFAHEGASDLRIAVLLGCLFAANAAGSLSSAPLQARLGAPAVLLVGLVVAAVGTALLVTTTADAGPVAYAWRLVVTGGGGGLVMATASAVAVSAVPASLAGTAGAVNNLLRQVGAALGAAVLGGVLAARVAGGASFTAAVHWCAGLLAAVLALTAALCAALLVRTGHHDL